MKHVIPAAALEQHIAVLAKTGSGKTYAIKAVVVEPLLEQHQVVGVIDPTGVWWGLRSSRDGKGAGFKVLVLGGDHGDMPLPANSGAAVARLLAEQRISLVADTSLLTVGERTRWFVDFGTTLYRINKAVLYLVLDEAHMFAPQGKVPDPDTGKMLHAANTLASGGRARGIRLTMITQRPAKLHKDTLTCADTLIAMRTLAPHDRQAVREWIDGCGDPAQGREILNSLAGLQRGEGWVWYPEGGFLERMKFPAIRTFDSSATPARGQTIAAPKGAAEIDLTEIKAALAEAVKEVEANDPKRLRARIAELERDAKKGHSQAAAPSGITKSELNDEYTRGRADGWEAGRVEAVKAFNDAAGKISAINSDLVKAMQRETTRLATVQLQLHGAAEATPSVAKRAVPVPRPAPAARPQEPRQAQRASGEDISLTVPQQRILDALAWLASIRPTDPADRTQLALLADTSPKSSGYANNLGALRTAGLIEYPYGSMVKLTDSGHAAAQAPAEKPTTEDLHRALQDKLTAPQWRIVKVLTEFYPKPVPREELANLADTSATSSGFANNLGALRSMGFLDYPSTGMVVAQACLFI